MKAIKWIILSALVVFTATAMANPLYTYRDPNLDGPNGATGRVVIDGLALTSARWTDWIFTQKVDDIAFDITFDMTTSTNVTAVTMVCETSRSHLTADDAGYEMVELTSTGTSAAPVATSGQVTWTQAVSADKLWAWTVKDAPSRFLNCKFDVAGTPAGTDLITVYARGITP